MQVKELSGHSGCGLYLCQNDEGIFVRKVSGSAKYNIRLKKQFLKQKYFHQEGLSVPAVLNYGYQNDMFYFDMQYLNCRTLAENVATLPMAKMDELVSFLTNTLPFDAPKWPEKSKWAFDTKIKSLLPYGNENKLYKESLDLLQLFDFSNIPNSYCCGDLTLENILISNEGHLYLIDFLDSFYNSWMIDVAKLLQDIDLHWSYRKNEMSANLKLRLFLLKQKIIQALLNLPDGENVCRTIYYVLLLNVMRIVPYIKDEVTFNFIQSALLKTMNTIKEMEK